MQGCKNYYEAGVISAGGDAIHAQRSTLRRCLKSLDLRSVFQLTIRLLLDALEACIIVGFGRFVAEIKVNRVEVIHGDDSGCFIRALVQSVSWGGSFHLAISIDESSQFAGVPAEECQAAMSL